MNSPKKEKKKEKKKKNKEEAISTRRVFANTAFVLKILWKTSPVYLVTYYLWTIGNAILNFFTNTYLLRYLLNCYSDGSSGITKAFIYLGVVLGLNLIWYFFIDYLRLLVHPKYTQRIVANIEELLFDKAGKVELACYEDPAFYDKYVRSMTDCYGKCMNVIYTIDNMLWSFISLVTNGALLFSIDARLMIFAFFPLLLGLVSRKRNKIVHEFDRKRDPIDRKINYVQRTFYLAEYAKEMRLGGIWRAMLEKQKAAWLSYKKLIADYGWAKGGCKFLLNIGQEVICVLGAMLYAVYCTVVQGSMSMADCLVILQSVGSISGLLTDFVAQLADCHKNALYIEDMRYFIDYDPALKSGTEPLPEEGDILFRGVDFSYAGAETPSLSGVNLTIRRGEKIALVGRNGSGKSTLVKLLLRLYDPTAGEILQAQTPLKTLDLDAYRAQYGVVFQDFKLFSLSVAENVLMRPYTEADEATVVEALKKSGAWEKVSAMPHGIHTILTREFDDEGVNLSGGEAQKVALARIFARPAACIIVDEPSSALDPIAEYQLFENLLTEAAGKTLIFISHRLSSAVLSDRVIYMENGRIAEEGAHRTLMEQNGAYAELFRKQAENYKLTPQKGGEAE